MENSGFDSVFAGMDPKVHITVARLRNSEIFAELEEDDLVSIAGFCREEITRMDILSWSKGNRLTLCS
jgi:hypothetical protein